MFKRLKDAAQLAKDLADAGRNYAVEKSEATKNAIITVTDATGFTTIRVPKLIFAMDATASRETSWAMAMQLQSEMVAMAGTEGLAIAIGYFNNEVCDVTSNYFTDARSAASYMRSIRMSSCYTKIVPLLREFEGHARNPNGARVAIFVGDSFEDNLAAVLVEAAKLKALGFRVFTLLEVGGSGGYVASGTEAAFRKLAEATGGVFARFDAGAKPQLRELMQSIAAYTAGTLSITHQGAFAEALKALPPPARK